MRGEMNVTDVVSLEATDQFEWDRLILSSDRGLIFD